MLQSGSVAVSPTVTLTQGTLTGSGTVNTVNVGAGTGGIISNNNGAGGAALSIGTLTLAGGANINLFSNGVSTAADLNVTTLTNNSAASAVTLTANNPSGWTIGFTYNLIGFTTLNGTGANNFAHVVNNLSSRQNATWGSTAAAITLTIGGDSPYWLGSGDGNWNTTSSGNWNLLTAGTPTTFQANDTALFDDNATGAGTITVTINAANVSPVSTTFSNNTKNYVLSGAFGISSGSLTMNGTGTLTIGTVNTYSGPTAINAGTTLMSGSGTLGTGSALTLGGGGLDLGGSSQTVGAVAITAAAASGNTIQNGSLIGTSYAAGNTSGNAIISANLLADGSAGFSMAGAGGTVTLAGANTYTGPSNITAGTVILGGSGTLGTGSALTLGGGGLDLGGSSQTVGAVSLTAAAPSGNTIQNGSLTGTAYAASNTSGDAMVSANLLANGAAGFTKSGVGGSVTLAGANTYTGNTVVTGGTLEIDGSSAGDGTGTTSLLSIGAGSGTSASVIVGSGAGTLTFGGDGFTNAAQVGINGGTGTLTLNGGMTNLAGASGQTAAMNIGVTTSSGIGTGTVTVNGGTLNVGGRILIAANNASNVGTLTLGGGTVSCGYSGGYGYSGSQPGVILMGIGNATVNLNSGTLDAYAFQSAGANDVINFNGGTLVAQGSPTYFLGNNGASGAAPTAAGIYTTRIQSGGAIINSNGFAIGLPTALVFDPAATGGGLTKGGNGTLTLSGANTYTGATTVNGGRLQLDGLAASGTLTTGGVTVGSGGTLGFTTGAVSTLDLTGKSLTLGGGTVAFDIGASGVNDSITVNDFTLTANSTFSLNPVGAVNNGASYTLLTSANPITANGFTLAGQTIGKLTLAPTLNTNTVTVTFALFEGIWNQSGGGLWSNGDPGATGGNGSNYKPTVAGDAVLFGSAISAAATVTVDSPVSVGYMVFDNLNTYTIGTSGSSNLTLDNGASNAFVTVNSGSHVIAENVVLASNTLVLPASGTMLTVGGALSGAGGLLLNDAGTLVLSGANSSTGATTIGAGVLRADSASALGTGGNITFAGGKLQYTATSAGSNWASRFRNSASAITLDTNGQTVVLAGIIDNTNSGGLTKIGTGTLGLSGANTYTGATTISGGTLEADNASALGNGGNITFAGGNLQYTANSASTNWASRFKNSASAIPLDTNGQTVALAGVIDNTNSGGLTKLGTGTLTLAGANTYTGATTLNGGTLLMSGGGTISNSSGIAVNNGATLTFARSDTWGQAGTSTASSPVTINSGGIVASGGSFNTLWNLALNGGTLISNGGVNVQYGSFDLAGTVTAAAGVTSSITSGTGTNNVINLGNGTTASNTTFNVGAGGTLNVGTVLQKHWYYTTSSQSVAAGLIKTGAGTLTLSAANTYTGPTTVNAGTLALGANGALPATTAVAIGSATLDATTSTDATGTLAVTGGATINLGSGATLAFADSSAISWSGGTLAITGSFVSGVSLRFGTTGSGLTSAQLALITGLGTATLDANGYLIGGTPYSLWSGGAAFNSDSNGDGIANGLAWILGAIGPSANGQAVLPVPGTESGFLTLHFQRVRDLGPAHLYLDYSNDLNTLDPWHVIDLVAGPLGDIVVVDVTGSPNDDVTVKIPSATHASAKGKLFARLHATED